MSENPKPNTKDSPSRSETGRQTGDDSSDDGGLPKRSRDQPSPDSEHAPVEATPSTSQHTASPSQPQQGGNSGTSRASQATPSTSQHTAGPSQSQQGGNSGTSRASQATPSTSQHTAGPSQPQQGGNSGTSRASQAGAAPEAVWMTFIQEFYPDLLSDTYFLPPLHFNRAPHDVEIIAGQPALVRTQPSAPGQRVQQPAPPPAQVAGTAFVEIDPNIEPVRTQDSDWQDDTAQQRCLQALSEIPNQVMIVISSLMFQKYLNNPTNPLQAAAVGQLPSMQHSPVSQSIRDGECDIVVIHRRYGLLIGEIKSLGGSSHFGQQSPSQQTQILTKKLKKALQQIKNQETALRHLVSDLPPITITKVLLLPNITAQQLRTALQTSPSLLATLCQTMSLHTDASLAVRRCLCEEDLQRPDSWWQMLHTGGSDPVMTDGLYERLVARFCGPATTVDVATAGLPRKVLRSRGEAVAETGLRFSSLTLTRRQVALLNTQPEPRHLYLSGPPGTGKTIVLLLKALQWVQQGRQVVIVSGDDDSRAVSLLLEEQLRSMAGPAAANLIQRLCCDFWPRDDDGVRAVVRAAVTRLQRIIRPGPVLVINDEFNPVYGRDIRWLEEVRARLPAVTVWTAGIRRHDVPEADPLPSWLQVETLQEALRCPPSVTAVLQKSYEIQDNDVPRYTAPQVAVATQGPPVQRLRHEGQPGHSGRHPQQCVACADNIADVLHQLRVGQPGHTLQFRDVLLIVRWGIPSADNVMARRLQHHHHLPVAVTSRRPSEAELRELALAVTDQIMVAWWTAVQGLERRVVVVLGDADHLPSCSRCSSSLYTIE